MITLPSTTEITKASPMDNPLDAPDEVKDNNGTRAFQHRTRLGPS